MARNIGKGDEKLAREQRRAQFVAGNLGSCEKRDRLTGDRGALDEDVDHAQSMNQTLRGRLRDSLYAYLAVDSAFVARVRAEAGDEADETE